MRVLVLCLGNINRSPACAAVLAREPGLEVRSAGFRRGGLRASLKMREAMAARGYNLETHRSSIVTRELAEWAETIVVMGNSDFERLIPIAGRDLVNFKCTKLANWDIPQVSRIHDPGFLPRGPKFDAIVDQVVRCSQNLARDLASRRAR